MLLIFLIIENFSIIFFFINHIFVTDVTLLEKPVTHRSDSVEPVMIVQILSSYCWYMIFCYMIYSFIDSRIIILLEI
ncbi:hypothetical protein DD606_26310 [Enterobacter cloacae complex sp. GF14B]|nr:hypothetical protein DD606_26310 [Enterobacter cloacae complex sp. GF14B]